MRAFCLNPLPRVGYAPFVLLQLRIIACLALLFLSACGRESSTPQPPAKQSRGVIGLSVLTLTNPFFKEIADKMTEEAAKHGYSVSVVSGPFWGRVFAICNWICNSTNRSPHLIIRDS